MGQWELNSFCTFAHGFYFAQIIMMKGKMWDWSYIFRMLLQQLKLIKKWGKDLMMKIKMMKRLKIEEIMKNKIGNKKRDVVYKGNKKYLLLICVVFCIIPIIAFDSCV